MAKSNQTEFKAFERLFNKIRRAKKEERQGATGTLTPGVLRQHLESGAPLGLIYGVKPDGTPFDVDDLKRFDKHAKKARRVFGSSKKGVRIDQLIAASRADDIERSRKQIRQAVFYRIFNSKDGVVLHFRVTASPGSQAQHHQVKIRLEEWTDWLTSTLPFKQAANKILSGRVSFDCDCGRHQYWFRYVATIGGFAVAPAEHSYPKIRNPKLTGACCKHVLKAFAAIRGPAVRRIIIGEMQKAADAISFGDDEKTASRYLTAAELKKAARSSSATKSATHKEARAAFRDYLKAKRGIKKKMPEKASAKALKRLELERATMEALARKEQLAREREQRKNKRLSRDILLQKLNAHMALAIYRDKMERTDAIDSFAKANKLTKSQVNELAEGLSI